MNILALLESSLIVSCQAPPDSPLHEPEIIAAIAQACVNQGAKGVRIDTPAHIQAVRKRLPDTPIIGLWKQTDLASEVYITPRFQDAVAIAQAGADIIAIDATNRKRPQAETLSDLIRKIQQELGKPVMADIDTVANGLAAAELGADLVATTLYGYTAATQHLSPPGYDLLKELKAKLEIPVICEGGIASPNMAQQALELGAFAVVVGTAITGIDLQTQAFQAVFEH